MNLSKLTLYLLSVSAFILSTFLFFKGINLLELREYYFAQSIFFITLALSSAVFIFFFKRFKIYYLIVTISMFFSLYVFEGYIFINSDIDFFTNKSSFYNNNKFYLKKEAIKTNSYPLMRINNKDLITFSGMPNVRTIHCNENGYFSKYQSDRFGFNNPDHVWDKVPDIILIGDSFIHGACVNGGKDISSVIRKNSNLNVINLGQYSTGSLRQFASFQEHIKNFPQHVLWFYFENDLDNLKEELKDQILLKYLVNTKFDQKLNEKFISEEINKEFQLKYENFLSSQFKDEAKQSYFKNFYDFIKLYKTRQIILSKLDKSQNKGVSDYKEKSDKLLNKHLKIVNRMKNILQKNNATLTIIYLPSKNYKFSDRSNFHEFIKLSLLNFSKKNNINFIDIDASIKKDFIIPNILYPKFDRGMHFNEKGYKYIGTKILKYLENEKLF